MWNEQVVTFSNPSVLATLYLHWEAVWKIETKKCPEIFEQECVYIYIHNEAISMHFLKQCSTTSVAGSVQCSCVFPWSIPRASEPGLSNCISKRIDIVASRPASKQASKQPSTGKCPLDWRRAQVLGMKGESFESCLVRCSTYGRSTISGPPCLRPQCPRLICLPRQKLTQQPLNDWPTASPYL